MANIKQEAQAYEPPQTLNIADLDRVSVELELKDGEGKNNKDETFTYKFIVVDGKQYRVAGTVIGQLKEILKKMPDLQEFSVLKSGEGLATKYQVIPYTGPQ